MRPQFPSHHNYFKETIEPETHICNLVNGFGNRAPPILNLQSYNRLVEAVGPDAGNARAFHHSEQRILAYLSQRNDHELPRIIDEINRIRHASGYPDANSIKAVILHVHSTRDPCANCNKTLSLFSHYARQIVGHHFHHASFLLTVSSRRD